MGVDDFGVMGFGLRLLCEEQWRVCVKVRRPGWIVCD